jgi:pimeloyl-ACP methyl ester carboxylesterase
MSARPSSAERLIDTGRGPALLFLHHFGGSARSWTGVIDRLSDQYRCIATDLPGFGTANRRPRPFTTASSADHVLAVADRLGLRDYQIVGHSMGGKIALAAAARTPPGLRGLVLLAPSPPTPEPISGEDRARLLASAGNHLAMAEIVAKISVRPLSLLDRERLVEDMLEASREAWAAWLDHGSREDISASLDKIAVSITIVAGDEDRTITAAVLRRELLERAPGARMETIAGAGHLLPIEARDEVAAIIQDSQGLPAVAGAAGIYSAAPPARGI